MSESLSAREFDVLMLLAQSMTNKEIAKELYISPLTVRNHTASIYRKMSVNGRREAVDRAYELGLLTRI